MYEKYQKIFNDYVLNYKGKDPNIEYKINHSYRVANLCVDIANSLDLKYKDREICYICGLFHDIGRFEQLNLTKSFTDSKLMDHGDIGAEILEKDLANVKFENEEPTFKY